MPDEADLPPPEPKEIDSQKWLEWKDVMDRAILHAHPLEEFGCEYRCDNCLFYLDPDETCRTAGIRTCGSLSAATGGVSGGRRFPPRSDADQRFSSRREIDPRSEVTATGAVHSRWRARRLESASVAESR